MVIIVALLPKFVWRHIRSTYFPDDVEIIRQIEKYDPNHDFLRDPGMPNLRAAKAYGVPLPGVDDVEGRASMNGAQRQEEGTAQQVYPMAHLHPVQSRASSIHHDMLTGQRTPVRGYSFSADEPVEGRMKRKHTLRNRLLPSGLRRTLTRRRDRRLSTIGHSDAGHGPGEDSDGDEDAAYGPSADADEFGRSDAIAHPQRTAHLEPGPEEDDEEDEDENVLERAEDTVVPPVVTGQMNGAVSTVQ